MTDVSINETELTLKSEILNRDVVCTLYLPEMDDVIEPLHLLLLNDGQDLPTMQYSQILHTLYQKRQIKPVLTVGITAGERLKEYGISGQPDFKGRGAEAEQYRRFVVEELMPAITENTGISTFASSTMGGFSLGALSAFDIAWHHTEIFNKVGAFSGSFWWRSKDLKKGYTDRFRIAHKMVRETPHKPELKFWFEAGTQDEKSDRNKNGIIDSIDDVTGLIMELYKKGYQRGTDVTYIELIGGKHDVETWGKMMPDFLIWAYGN